MARGGLNAVGFLHFHERLDSAGMVGEAPVHGRCQTATIRRVVGVVRSRAAPDRLSPGPCRRGPRTSVLTPQEVRAAGPDPSSPSRIKSVPERLDRRLGLMKIVLEGEPVPV